VIVAFLYRIHAHYVSVGKHLRDADRSPGSAEQHHVVLLVGKPSAAERRAYAYASLIDPTDLECVHFAESGEPKFLEAQWARNIGVLSTPSFSTVQIAKGGLAKALRTYAKALAARLGPHDFVTFVVSERIRPGLVRGRFGNPKAFLIKAALLFTPGIVVTDVPVVEVAGRDVLVPGGRPRHDVIVLVSGVHNATLRAIEYARSLHADSVRAVHIKVEEAETSVVTRDWAHWDPGLELEIVDSPYREIGEVLRTYIETMRGDNDDVVTTVVLPEFLPKKLWHHLLHNQTALTLKGLFLREPGVVLTSIPYRL
jgi:hypothetical protein